MTCCRSRENEQVEWRSSLLYEYYWERNFPQTPTVHALREDRYKYIHFHGIWDIDELYDLKEDPLESRNLIFSPGHEHIIERLNAKLFDMLEATGGLQIPLPRDVGERKHPARCPGKPDGRLPGVVAQDACAPDHQKSLRTRSPKKR